MWNEAFAFNDCADDTNSFRVLFICWIITLNDYFVVENAAVHVKSQHEIVVAVGAAPFCPCVIRTIMKA